MRPQGTLISFGPDRTTERDTLTCCHGNHIIVVQPGQNLDTHTWFCTKCCKRACYGCSAEGTCRPFEAWLDAMEKSPAACAEAPVVCSGIFELRGLTEPIPEILTGITCFLVDQLDSDRAAVLCWEEPIGRHLLACLNVGPRAQFALRPLPGALTEEQIRLAGSARFAISNKLAQTMVGLAWSESLAELVTDRLNRTTVSTGRMGRSRA